MNNEIFVSKYSSLPDELKKEVNAFIDSLLSRNKKPEKEKKKKSGRGYGSMKGQIKMSKDFDEPLDDFNEYMY
ncbi:MAG: DUF2281 domain-containing protein [Bacteroidia bacterium]